MTFNFRVLRDEEEKIVGERIKTPPDFRNRALIDDIDRVVWVKRGNGEIESLNYDSINYFVFMDPADAALFHKRVGPNYRPARFP